MVSSKKADDDSSGQAMTEERQTTPSSTPTRSSSMLRYFQTLDRIDVFGFSLTWKQLLIVLIAAGMMLGENGLLAFSIALVAYHGFNWMTGNSSSHTTSNKRGFRSRFNGTGSNIRGVNDLPKDPSGG